MKRFILLALLCLLLAGCANEEAMPTPPAEIAIPTETTVPAVPEGEGGAVNTVILREADDALRLDYSLLSVASDAPFAAEDVTVNTAGAEALITWLTSRETLELAAEFGMETYGDNLYYVNYEGTSAEEIAPAEEDTARIRLSAVTAICDSGLLDALLPLFEEAYGYTVEVTPNETFMILSNAKRGGADVLLTASPSLEAQFLQDGFAERAVPFVHNYYVLCGPREDPAGTAACADIQEAFAAIAGGKHTFISRGDGFSLHLKEASLWPEDLGITTAADSAGPHTDWYVCADSDTGPCVIMAEMMGGYVLCDKLTYLIYYTNDGFL